MTINCKVFQYCFSDIYHHRTVLMCHGAQRQSGLSLLDVRISSSSDLFYTCIRALTAQSQSRQVVLKMNCVRSCSFYSGYQTLLRLYE